MGWRVFSKSRDAGMMTAMVGLAQRPIGPNPASSKIIPFRLCYCRGSNSYILKRPVDCFKYRFIRKVARKGNS